MTALYAFAKLVDDWGDSQTTLPHAEQANEWHRWIDNCFKPSNDSVQQAAISSPALPTALEPIQIALMDSILRFKIPSQYLHEIVEGVTLDLAKPFSIADRKQLDRYCYLVASTVGLACLSIWDGNQANVHSAAIDCGRAFQLTNILRDIKEDSERGRIYVPLDLLAAHHVDIEQWMQGHPSGDWRAVLETMVDWAQAGYQSGWHVCDALHDDGQRMFSLMWHTYHRLLERIASDLDAVWKRRIQLSQVEKVTLFLQHAWTPLYRQCFNRDESHE